MTRGEEVPTDAVVAVWTTWSRGACCTVTVTTDPGAGPALLKGEEETPRRDEGVLMAGEDRERDTRRHGEHCALPASPWTHREGADPGLPIRGECESCTPALLQRTPAAQVVGLVARAIRISRPGLTVSNGWLTVSGVT